MLEGSRQICTKVAEAPFQAFGLDNDILLQGALIALDGEQMVATSLDDVLGNFPLGQQGIGGDIEPLDVADLKQGNGGDRPGCAGREYPCRNRAESACFLS